MATAANLRATDMLRIVTPDGKERELIITPIPSDPGGLYVTSTKRGDDSNRFVTTASAITPIYTDLVALMRGGLGDLVQSTSLPNVDTIRLLFASVFYVTSVSGNTMAYHDSLSQTSGNVASTGGQVAVIIKLNKSSKVELINKGEWNENHNGVIYEVVPNTNPTLSLSTTNARTLYENDTYGVSGSTLDVNSGDVVSVKYQVNSGVVRAINTAISTGASIPFNKVLTFKAGALYDGAAAVTPAMAEGTQHVLKVWAEDDKGGKSAEQIRTFYVVPNRPASLTIEPFASATDLINTDRITINGNVSDPDNNSITVKYKIGNGSYTEVYSGSGGSFSFQIPLSALAIGKNSITVQATDSFGAVTPKTLQITKSENTQPLKTAVTRYKLTPPNGAAKGVLLWIEREVGDLIVDAEISMGMSGDPEDFQPMTKSATAFVSSGIEEDEFIFEADSPKENIVLKLTMARSSTASDKGITLISGVLN